MNRDKVKELRRRIHPTTDIDADWRFALTDLIDALLEDNNVYPPESPDSSPRVDRSLRGPVVVEDGDGQWFRYAVERGLSDESEYWTSGVSWEDVESHGWTVRKLTPEDIGFRVRRWDEWTQGERDSYRYDTEVRLSYTGMRVDKAIDIALRGTHE